ncbi:MAG: ABC transporter ATP-binding protein [Actinobacteria bacterium]|nr:ABC transporter ATP-binding protein [Actinomycetota bacterium]
MSGKALEAVDLVKDYPRPGAGMRSLLLPAWKRGVVRALDGVSFAVERGTVCGLLGSNGAGKTTFIRIAAGLLLPTSGSVLVWGKDAGGGGTQTRGRLGMAIGEERSFYWRLTGRQNLEFFASLHGMGARATAERTRELAELLGLDEVLDVPFSDHSAGMRQRMALARALLHDPDLLLLDEPTRSLSPEAALPLQCFIREELAGRRGKTVLLATQDMREAERLCRDVVLLHRGHVLFAGPLSRLLEEGRRELGADAALEDIFIHKMEIEEEGYRRGYA